MQVHRRMAENDRHHDGTGQIEDDHREVSDEEGEAAAEAARGARRGTTRRRLRTIVHRKSGLRTEDRREESAFAGSEEDRG